MPEVVRPNSAEGVEVVTLNSCNASIEGEVSSKDEPFSLRWMLAPSSSTSAPYACPPLSLEKNTPLPVFPRCAATGARRAGQQKDKCLGRA